MGGLTIPGTERRVSELSDTLLLFVSFSTVGGGNLNMVEVYFFSSERLRIWEME